ncbi:MAG: 50S ribosomal protein L4 [Acidimicrobiales bacterium]
MVESWNFAAPRTKEAKAALTALGVTGRALIILGPDDHTAGKSFRNLPDVHLLPATDLNAYDILRADWVIFTRATLPGSAEAPDSGPTSEGEA